MAVISWILENVHGGFSRSIVVGTVITAIILQICVKAISSLLNFKKRKHELKDFPGIEPYWLYGNLDMMPKPERICDFFIDQVKQYDKCVQFWIGPYSTIRLVHPDYIQAIFKTAEPKTPFYRTLHPWIGKGLLTSEGKQWARARRLLTPAFHFEILKPYVKIFNTTTCTMIDKWKKEIKSSSCNSFDMFEHVSQMTLDSLLRCAFTYDTDVQTTGRKSPYIDAVYKLSELTVKRNSSFFCQSDILFYLSYDGYQFRHACKTAHKLSSSVISTRHNDRKHQNYFKNRKYIDFLDILLDAKDSDGNGLTDREIQNEVDTFLFEGHDTTASGISYCLYNLARHPQYQTKCRDEINEVLGERTEIEWDDLANLNYLTMCIKESLRIHPPVPGVGRRLTKPLTFPDGRTAPTDTWLVCSIFSSHHNPTVWETPEVYDPERFSAENSKERSPHAFIPFSAGPRNCIGKQFAMNELKTCVALLLKNFELSVDESKPVTFIPELILRSKGGLWLTLKPIN